MRSFKNPQPVVAFRDPRTHCVLLSGDTLATHTVRYGKAELVTQWVYFTYIYPSVSRLKKSNIYKLTETGEENEQAESPQLSRPLLMIQILLFF